MIIDELGTSVSFLIPILMNMLFELEGVRITSTAWILLYKI